MNVYGETDGERGSERERVRQTDKVREREKDVEESVLWGVEKLIVFIGTDGQIQQTNIPIAP